jgi:hypothetical protein
MGELHRVPTAGKSLKTTRGNQKQPGCGPELNRDKETLSIELGNVKKPAIIHLQHLNMSATSARPVTARYVEMESDRKGGVR